MNFRRRRPKDSAKPKAAVIDDDNTRDRGSKKKSRNQEIRSLQQKLVHRKAARAKEVSRPQPMGCFGRMILDDLDAEILKIETRLKELGA